MHGAITHLIAGVPVSDLDASIDWYMRYFGRPPPRKGPRSGWERDRVRRAARRSELVTVEVIDAARETPLVIGNT